MAITRIASQDILATSSLDNLTATYPFVPTAGNLLIGVAWGSVAPPTASISGTNWTIAIEKKTGNGTGEVVVFYKIAQNAEPTAVTATLTGAGATKLHLYEYQGNATTNVLIGTQSFGQGDTNAVTSRSTGTLTVTGGQSDYLLFTVLGVAGGSATSPSWDSNVSLRQQDAAIRIFDGDLEITANGDYSSTASWTTSLKSVAIMVAFKAGRSNVSSDARRTITAPDGISVSGGSI